MTDCILDDGGTLSEESLGPTNYSAMAVVATITNILQVLLDSSQEESGCFTSMGHLLGKLLARNIEEVADGRTAEDFGVGADCLGKFSKCILTVDIQNI